MFRLISTVIVVCITVGVIYYAGFLNEDGERVVEATVEKVGKFKVGDKELKDVTVKDVFTGIDSGINYAKDVTEVTDNKIIFKDGSTVEFNDGTLTVDLETNEYKDEINKVIKEKFSSAKKLEEE